MIDAGISTPFLGVAVRYRTVVLGVQLTFQIPESVLKDFEDYVKRMKVLGYRWSDQWDCLPILRSIAIGVPDKGSYGWDHPINKPLHGPSRKGIIKRLRTLSKRETLIAVTEEIHPRFWEKIQERAAFHGISPGELCLSCIGYHAGLERGHRERERPKTSFDSFERALAKEARQKPRIPVERAASNIL